MKTAVVALTRAGARLAADIARKLGGEAYAPDKHCPEGVLVLDGPIAEWTKRRFNSYDAFIFISACGIAVRAIAACVSDKLAEPAVVVMDERSRYAIPLLCGDAGGANELAARLAELTGGEAVITTAEINEAAPVEAWAAENGCALENRSALKHVSDAAHEGVKVGVAVSDELVGAPFPVTLFLRPRGLVLGVICGRGATLRELQNAADDFLKKTGHSILSLYAIASIDILRGEDALVAFSKRHVLDFACFGDEELSAVSDSLAASGACERAAVLCSGGGALLCGETVYGNITLALARRGAGEC